MKYSEVRCPGIKYPGIKSPVHLVAVISLATILAACAGGNSPGAVVVVPQPEQTASATPTPGSTMEPTLPPSPQPTSTPEPEIENPQVSVQKGLVVGSLEDEIRRFYGIPYAAPPVGDLRFEAPQPVEAWSSPRMAQMPAPPCAQVNIPGISLSAFSQEDCLYLNVIAPENVNNAPVLVWIHGGALMAGAGTYGPQDGIDFVNSTGVILVSFNYRLGAFGFLAHPSLEDEMGASGTLGFLDQIAALEWVQANIAAFGGDPNRVGIFGESAGAMSVCSLMAAPAAQGLFKVGLMASGGCPVVTYEQALSQGQAAVAQSPCAAEEEVKACLQQLSVDEVKAISNGIADGFQVIFPHYDGVHTLDPYTTLAEETSYDVPLLVGANSDELQQFSAGFTLDGEADYLAAIVDTYGQATADAIAPWYPFDLYGEEEVTYSQLVSDMVFHCPSIALAEAAKEGQPVYLYQFEQGMNHPAFDHLGAFHGLFGIMFFNTIPGYTFTDTERELMTTIWQDWVGFIETGSLDGGAAYESASAPYKRYNSEVTVASPFRDGRCEQVLEHIHYAIPF